METAKVRPAAPAATGLVLVGRAAGRPLYQRPPCPPSDTIFDVFNYVGTHRIGPWAPLLRPP